MTPIRPAISVTPAIHAIPGIMWTLDGRGNLLHDVSRHAFQQTTAIRPAIPVTPAIPAIPGILWTLHGEDENLLHDVPGQTGPRVAAKVLAKW